MTKGILGRKIGMTQVFGENGELIPVTVVEASQNVVLQKKTEEVDGYNAIQVGFEDKQAYKKGSKSNKYANKPAEGHAKKADTAPKRFIVNSATLTLTNTKQVKKSQLIHSKLVTSLMLQAFQR